MKQRDGNCLRNEAALRGEGMMYMRSTGEKNGSGVHSMGQYYQRIQGRQSIRAK